MGNLLDAAAAAAALQQIADVVLRSNLLLFVSGMYPCLPFESKFEVRISGVGVRFHFTLSVQLHFTPSV